MANQKQQIVFFDGVCNLCNSAVQRIIKNDTNNVFFFASIQSKFTEQFFLKHHFSATIDSVILWNGTQFFTQSSAALQVAKKLKFPYPLLQFFFIVPPVIRNSIYRLIANNRYRWFGKKDYCMLPEKSLQHKFLNA